MRFGVLGTGMVGEAIGGRLVELGHDVMMGSRSAVNEKAGRWAGTAGDRAAHGTFADSASFGETIVNCTAGTASIDALRLAGEDNLSGKVLIDVANPLDFSRGMPPTLSVCNDDSLGERIQAAFPRARVVKALNTVNRDVMVHPQTVPGSHVVFVCGNDGEAKDQVRRLLESFGWPAGRVLDLGDITGSRGAEMYLPLWLRMMATFGTGRFNISVER